MNRLLMQSKMITRDRNSDSVDSTLKVKYIFNRDRSKPPQINPLFFTRDPPHKPIRFKISDLRQQQFNSYSNESIDLFRLDHLCERDRGNFHNKYLDNVQSINRNENFEKCNEAGKKIKYIDAIKSSYLMSQNRVINNCIRSEKDMDIHKIRQQYYGNQNNQNNKSQNQNLSVNINDEMNINKNNLNQNEGYIINNNVIDNNKDNNNQLNSNNENKDIKKNIIDLNIQNNILNSNNHNNNITTRNKYSNNRYLKETEKLFDINNKNINNPNNNYFTERHLHKSFSDILSPNPLISSNINNNTTKNNLNNPDPLILSQKIEESKPVYTNLLLSNFNDYSLKEEAENNINSKLYPNKKLSPTITKDSSIGSVNSLYPRENVRQDKNSAYLKAYMENCKNVGFGRKEGAFSNYEKFYQNKYFFRNNNGSHNNNFNIFVGNKNEGHDNKAKFILNKGEFFGNNFHKSNSLGNIMEPNTDNVLTQRDRKSLEEHI